MLNNKNQTFILYIHFSNNNILFNLTKLNGDSIYFTTVGSKKTNGIRKINLTTLKSSILVLSTVLRSSKIHILVKGLTKFKRITLKLVVKVTNTKILSFCDVTSLPHNGVKKSKNRRI